MIAGSPVATAVPRRAALCRPRQALTSLPPAWNNPVSLFDTAPLEAYIQATIGDKTFDELPRRFATVACDILIGERVELQSGPLARGVRASVAMPGLFPPVEIDGRLLADGGVVDNVPVDVARELGADYVIAIDLWPRPGAGRRPENLFDVLITAADLWSHANHPDPATVDCSIVPEIGKYRAWDFDAVPELNAHGRTAAERVIVRLKEDLGFSPRETVRA